MPILERKWTVKHKRSIRTVWVVLGIFMIVVILAQFSFFTSIIQSIQFRFTALARSTSEIWQGIYESPDTALQQADYYQDLLEEQAIEKSYVNLLEQEVAELQEYVFYVPSEGYEKIIARVIVRSLEGDYKMIIDKGSEDGIQIGMGVVASRGSFVGSITKVGNHSAEVTLLAHKTSSVPATILGTNYTTGIVEGQSGYLLLMDYIPQEEYINVGDTIVTSGLKGLFPSNLVIGVVQKVIKDESEPFQQALIQPTIDARDMLYFSVLQPAIDL